MNIYNNLLISKFGNKQVIVNIHIESFLTLLTALSNINTKIFLSLRIMEVDSRMYGSILVLRHCVKCLNMEFFLVRIFLYSDSIRSRNKSRKSPYSVRIQINTDQKKNPYLDAFHAVTMKLIINQTFNKTSEVWEMNKFLKELPKKRNWERIRKITSRDSRYNGNARGRSSTICSLFNCCEKSFVLLQMTNIYRHLSKKELWKLMLRLYQARTSGLRMYIQKDLL